MQLGNRVGKLGFARYEQTKSTYNRILMTTTEGRIASGPNERIKDGSYDAVFTAKTPKELRYEISKYDSQFRNNFYNQIRVLDPMFYEKIQGMNMDKDENANIVIDYLTSKVNNPVSKENLLEAIINVKKTIYKNFNEQDFEDMKMAYSITEPFSIPSANAWEIDTSLYGNKYDEYLERRYNDLKDNTSENAQKNNLCLNVNLIINNERKKRLQDDKIFSSYSSDNSTRIYDEKYVRLLEQNKDKVKALGIDLELSEDEEFGMKYAKITIQELEKNATIEEQMEKLVQDKRKLYIALGLEKEKSQTQILGQQTLDEQNDTVGKSNVQNELSRQLENEKMQNDPIIE